MRHKLLIPALIGVSLSFQTQAGSIEKPKSSLDDIISLNQDVSQSIH